MWKYLAIFAVILGITIYVSIENQHDTERAAQQSAQPSNPPITPGTHDEKAAQNGKKSERNSPSWYGFFTWPDSITAWAIFLTLLAIAEQASEASKATKAMRRSIEVQEAEFAQWLDIGEWAVEHDKKDYQLGRSGTQIINHPGEITVRISFPLFNNTARPLFIKSVRTLLAIGTEKVLKTFSTEESITVPPKDEYRVVIDTILDKEQVTGYIAYMLPIEAVVEVNFSNALHKPDYAGFRRLVMCNAFDGITTVSKGHISKEIDNRETI